MAERQRRRRLQDSSLLEHHQHRPKAMLHVVLAAFVVFLAICGIEGMQNGGLSLRTYARINDTFELGCYVAQAGGKLNFYDDNELVPENFIKRINDSYVIYTNSYSKPTKKNITCKRRDERRNRLDNVGMSEVFVDGEIASVNDFKCRTTDFQNLTCTFKPPMSVFTHKYSLTVAKNSGKKARKCKLELDSLGGRTCRISIGKDSLRTVFSFTLHAENNFYEKVEIFKVQLLESLVPRKLDDAFVRVSKPQHNSASNASIVFTLPRELEKASRDLVFDVRLKAKDESESKWRSISFDKFEKDGSGGGGGGKEETFLPLDDLEYANTIYQYKVRIKSKTSRDIDEMWSPYFVRTFKTGPKPPEMIAKVCENCFNVMDNGNIFLHWMEVPKFYRNAEKFSYLVRILNEEKELLYEVHHEKPMLMMPKGINATALTIHIFSSNAEGLSRQYSVAHVSIEENKNLLNIKKELIDDMGYKLSWKLEAVDAIDVVSYTILFCRQRNELPNQCDSSIKYLEVASNEFEFVLNTTHSYQFGVAVNRRGGHKAAGFQWAMCTASKPNEIGVIRSIWSRFVTENAISLEWKLNCADKDIVYGYNVSYCIVADFDRNLCMENPKHEVIYDNHDNRNVYQLSLLKPYKQYNISVAMISTSERIGAFSSPLTVRTLEASPTAPRNLEALDVTENAITLLWQRPLEVNGPSLTYQLWWNDKMIRIDNNQTMNESYRHTIGSLMAFTNYTVAVVACTRNCSESSGSLYLRTSIGKPGQISHFDLNSFENRTIQLFWKRPVDLGGHLDYFLLNVLDDSGNSKFYKIDGQRTNCSIDAFVCDNSNVYFSIGGVNIDDGGVSGAQQKIPSHESPNCLFYPTAHRNYGKKNHLYGDMSAPRSAGCRFDYSSIPTIIGNSVVATVITAVFLLSILALFAYVLLRIYNRIQEMKDIHIVWPAGMESYSLDKPESNNSIIHDNDFDDLMKHDLVMSHSLNNNNVTYNLGDIKEESYRDLENYDNAFKAKEIEQKNCHNVKNFARVPFIARSKTCEVIPNGPLDVYKKSNSVPSSPHNEIAKGDRYVDQGTGYMKMYSPVRSNNSISNIATAAGYCDMSGRSSSNSINHSNEIKSFLRESQNNNGYIQRKSILNKPFASGINSTSDYVCLRNVKN